MTVEVVPATAERFEDLATIIGPSTPGGDACWCLSCRLTSSENSRLVGPQREEKVRELTRQPVVPGLLAYVDGEVAGWVNTGPRAAIGRLQRSRTILPVDDVPVWCVLCFVVRKGFTGRGLTRELLRGATEFARAHSAPAIEGYPIDPAGGWVSSAFLYVGTASTFAAEGFEVIGSTLATSGRLPRLVMRKRL
ncbi:GNAT family N-acetyltransferase [Gryllotalpicola ginsengisoli]|uniref:GNAT family N-acetyltransferase n=1 Tax=Gryllotalpicola ginsengisoli TaxID=444608 RepID=UPI0003B30E88|nr:GNAT family N-acetyltransferase [Gryllotalpicola ginsengisoli]